MSIVLGILVTRPPKKLGKFVFECKGEGLDQGRKEGCRLPGAEKLLE